MSSLISLPSGRGLSMVELSVVLPAYNESENIEEMVADVVEAVERLTQDYEVIVVDDGSRDGTAPVVNSLEERYPQLRLVRHVENQGYGAAVFSGLTAAAKDFVFFTDADRQFDLAEIEELLSLADDAEQVPVGLGIGCHQRLVAVMAQLHRDGVEPVGGELRAHGLYAGARHMGSAYQGQEAVAGSQFDDGFASGVVAGHVGHIASFTAEM